jgi:putative membrane protein
MVKDHSMANKELMAIAKQQKIYIPQSLPNDKLEKLKQLDSFKDEAERNLFYADLMVKEHEEAVKLFAEAGQGEQNKALAQFAAKKLPALQHHLMEAQNVLKIMKSIQGDKGDRPLKISKSNQ